MSIEALSITLQRQPDWLCRRLYWCVGVSRLQSADVSLDLTGQGAPSGEETSQRVLYGLAVNIHRLTASSLVGLLPALPDRTTELRITGEQRRLHG